MISNVCDVVGEGAATLVSAPFDWLAAAVGSAAGWLFEQVWTIFDTTTLVDVTNPGYVKVYSLILGAALFVMLMFFCFQLVAGLVRHEAGALKRAVTGLAKSVLGSFVALTVTGLLLEATDQLCVGIVQASGETMTSMGSRIALLAVGLAGINLAAPGAGAILTIFLAGLAISAALIVWFSLLIRKALLLVSVVLAPFALAGQSWDATRGWFGKWASFVVAMILSKLVLVVTMLVAVTQTASPIAPDLASISEPIAGVVLMMVAAFAPYMTYKLIAFMGSDMYHLMSAEQEAKHAMNRPLPVRTPMGNPAAVLAGQSGGTNPAPPAGSGGQATSVTATTAPAAGGGGGGAAAGSGAGGAGSGAAAGGAGSAGAGAAAGAGPAAAVVVGAQVAQGAASAGPRASGAVGDAAAGQADAAAPPPGPPQPGSSAAPTTVFTPTAPTAPPPQPPPPTPHGSEG
ncbi:MAG: conjugal transfer protein TrbL [Bifidobacteriaceae bacterium]|nr:conjugal transfer protein TrbL [Bifidobacteriaceae bacterium]